MASTSPEPHEKDFLGLLAKVVNRAGLESVLIGGHAVNFWAEPRYTQDYDLTVRAEREPIEAAVRALLDEGFVVERRQDDGEASGPAFVRLSRRATDDFVDFIVAKTAFQDGMIDHAHREAGQPLPVATPEDLLVLKLIAGRSKDQRDAVVLAQSREIDWDIVEGWAEDWSIEDRLATLRQLVDSDDGFPHQPEPAAP